MSAKEKTKFEDLAKQDKERYDREMMNYTPVKGKKKKKFKDPNAPKRPPYVLHLNVETSTTKKLSFSLLRLQGTD